MQVRFASLAAAVAGLTTMSAVSFGAAISPGNLVVYRVGTGAAALGSGHTAVFLDEYTTAGALVQSLTVSASGAGALSAIGNATTEGIMSLSQNGQRIIFTGYRRDAGLGALTTSDKVIATLDLSGTINTSVAVNDALGTTVRSATTTDGSIYYMNTSGAVRYVGAPSGSSTSVVVDTRNSRQAYLFDSVLYSSNGSTAVTGKLQDYGMLPTTLTTPTVDVALATGDAINGFICVDQNPGVAGVDTMYVLSTVENLLRKYSKVGGVWTSNGSITASSALNITAIRNGASFDLYMTTSTTIRKLSDASGYNGTLTGTSSVIATAAANTGFRGISSFNAVPEPGTWVAMGIGALALLRRRKAR